MTTDSLTSIESGIYRGGGHGRVLLVLLAVGVPWGIWSVSVLLDCGGSQLAALDATMGCFVLLAVGYLGLYGLKRLAWYSVPVFVTLNALVQFIGIPAWLFATGGELADSLYVHAMLIALIGFTAFWIGSLGVMKEAKLRFAPRVGDKSNRLACISAVMLALGVSGKLVMWKVGLFSYIADPVLMQSSLWFIQWLVFIANLLNLALIVSAIEVFGRRSDGSFMKAVLWLSVIFSIGFGAISGMKSGVWLPLLYLLLIYCITNGRIPRIAFLLPLLVLIYPFSIAYRANLRQSYSRTQVNTVEGLEVVLKKSFVDVVDSPFTKGTIAGQGLDETVSRMSELKYVYDVISLHDYSLLQNDEPIWFAPLYPLVPRILWKDKPVLNKGDRLSIALGRPADTSSAITPIGDFYLTYGTPGVIIGMFLYGICLQLYTNCVTHGITTDRSLFVYILMLLQLANFEADVFSYVASAVQYAVIVVFMSYVIYGQSVFRERAARL
jgi:hypothetical protein